MKKKGEVSNIVFVKISQNDSLCEYTECDWHCDSCDCDDYCCDSDSCDISVCDD